MSTRGRRVTTLYFSYLRLFHFGAGWLLLSAAIIRIAGLFLASNKYQRWDALFPVKPRDLKNLFTVMQNYLFCRFDRGPHYIGHNPLQQVAYTGIYAVGTGRPSHRLRPLCPLCAGLLAVPLPDLVRPDRRHPVYPPRPPAGDVGVPHLHPDPCLPRDPGRHGRAGGGHLVDHQRRALVPEGDEVRGRVNNAALVSRAVSSPQEF